MRRDHKGDYELQENVDEVVSGGCKGEGWRRRGADDERGDHDDRSLLIHEEKFVQKPTYFTGMTWTRILMFPFSALVFGLSIITWIGYNQQTSRASSTEKAIFNFELFLMMVSYLQVMFLDPGGIPKGWHAKVAASPGLRDKFRLCRKTHLFKPPRAHFCSITNRQVLNFDHFCPWMVNAIGFYNKKFFVLFLFWCIVCCFHYSMAMLVYADFTAKGLLRDTNEGITITKFIAFALDAAMSFGVGIFLGVHVKFVVCNQTTMESSETRYDLGWRANVESVFGRNPWLWLLPVYGAGPVGDGVTWPVGRNKEGLLEEGGTAAASGAWNSESEFEDALDQSEEEGQEGEEEKDEKEGDIEEERVSKSLEREGNMYT